MTYLLVVIAIGVVVIASETVIFAIVRLAGWIRRRREERKRAIRAAAYLARVGASVVDEPPKEGETT